MDKNDYNGVDENDYGYQNNDNSDDNFNNDDNDDDKWRCTQSQYPVNNDHNDHN